MLKQDDTCEILKVRERVGLPHPQGSEVNRTARASSPHQTTSQALGCNMWHLLSSVPILAFPKDW